MLTASRGHGAHLDRCWQGRRAPAPQRPRAESTTPPNRQMTRRVFARRCSSPRPAPAAGFRRARRADGDVCAIGHRVRWSGATRVLRTRPITPCSPSPMRGHAPPATSTLSFSPTASCARSAHARGQSRDRRSRAQHEKIAGCAHAHDGERRSAHGGCQRLSPRRTASHAPQGCIRMESDNAEARCWLHTV